MKYTLRDFLSDHIVPGITLLTESWNFSAVPIQSSVIQEPPFDEFFEEDELVITKVMGWEHDEALMEELVHIADKAGVAALVWALHEKGASIPAPIIALANEKKVPLLEIPWEYPFAKIQADLRDAIHEKELDVFESLQQTLLNRFFELSPIEETAAMIAAAFQRPVQILDLQGRLISESRDVPAKEDALDALSPLPIDITISGIKYGTVRFLLSDESDELVGRTGELAKYVAFPLSLWFNRKNIEHVTESRIRNDFVWNLASGNYTSLEEMVEQGNYLGFDLSRLYTCIVLKVDFEEDPQAVQAYTQENARIASNIELLLQKEGKKRDLAIMTASLNLDFVFYLETGEQATADTIDRFIDRAESLILKAYPSAQCLWGISESPSEEMDFSAVYQQALQALPYCLNAGSGSRRFTYRNTRKAKIVAALAKDDDIKKGAEEVFGDLLAYDNESHVDLLQTLAEFIATNYNASQTAKNLHLNRQSLLYRLKKIEQLTGMSLHEHDDLFVLEVFSRIYTSY